MCCSILPFALSFALVAVVFALHPWLTAMVMSGQSVNLTTVFLARLSPPKW